MSGGAVNLAEPDVASHCIFFRIFANLNEIFGVLDAL